MHTLLLTTTSPSNSNKQCRLLQRVWFLLTVRDLRNYLSMPFISDTGPAPKSFKQLATGQTKLGVTPTHLQIPFCSITSLGSGEAFGLSSSDTGKDCRPCSELCSSPMRSSHTLSLKKEIPQSTDHERKTRPLLELMIIFYNV